VTVTVIGWQSRCHRTLDSESEANDRRGGSESDHVASRRTARSGPGRAACVPGGAQAAARPFFKLEKGPNDFLQATTEPGLLAQCQAATDGAFSWRSTVSDLSRDRDSDTVEELGNRGAGVGAAASLAGSRYASVQATTSGAALKADPETSKNLVAYVEPGPACREPLRGRPFRFSRQLPPPRASLRLQPRRRPSRT
jgi:hypothetical protein